VDGHSGSANLGSEIADRRLTTPLRHSAGISPDFPRLSFATTATLHDITILTQCNAARYERLQKSLATFAQRLHHASRVLLRNRTLSMPAQSSAMNVHAVMHVEVDVMRKATKSKSASKSASKSTSKSTAGGGRGGSNRSTASRSEAAKKGWATRRRNSKKK
jgi:hypothetical protein